MSQADYDKRRSRGIGGDMSPEAILHRLDIVSELRRFTRFLATAKKIENNAEIRSQQSVDSGKSEDADAG